MQEHCPNVPFILVGTQTDRKVILLPLVLHPIVGFLLIIFPEQNFFAIQNDPKVLEELAGQKPIDFKTGEKRAKEIKAVKYVECSAKEIGTVTNVFRSACQYLLEVDDKRKQKVAKLAKKEVWDRWCSLIVVTFYFRNSSSFFPDEYSSFSFFAFFLA